MESSPPESRVALLRRRAVKSLESTKYPVEAEQLLERLVSVAMEGSDDALFAHRELAQLQLERSPWNAALHLRKVIAGRPDEHAPYALMGLCQALLSNFRMAVSSYERAIALAPDIPGYQHNLGHFLDVAMDRPEDALVFLERAHRLAPTNPEITASFAHCLARCGRLGEAEALADDAALRAPDEAAHRRLLVWIRAGAPAETPGDVVPRQKVPRQPVASRQVAKAAAIVTPSLVVLARIQDRAKDSRSAKDLAEAFFETQAKWSNPAALAAAIDYLSAESDSQRVVAKRHDVGVSALARRVALVRDALPE